MRRVNLLFESWKVQIAVRLDDPSIVWRDCDSGIFRRLAWLTRGLGVRLACYRLFLTARRSLSKDWSGAERRDARGSIRDRQPGQPDAKKRRRYDSADFLSFLNRLMSRS
jgi:hypothetical protein